MPAQQRRRRDNERAPACSREQTAGGGKEDSIGRFQVSPPNLATQDSELVPEHDDLQLLETARAEAKRGPVASHDVERGRQATRTRTAPPEWATATARL